MTNYADYAYYTGTYKGAVIDTASFDTYARKATQLIKLHTFNRIKDDNIPNEAKMCCCELAEEMYKHEKEDVGNITSEKVGEYSVSYMDKEKAESVFRGKYASIIYNWLATTGLLYRGC
jgi:hypothetical protein